MTNSQGLTKQGKISLIRWNYPWKDSKPQSQLQIYSLLIWRWLFFQDPLSIFFKPQIHIFSTKNFSYQRFLDSPNNVLPYFDTSLFTKHQSLKGAIVLLTLEILRIFIGLVVVLALNEWAETLSSFSMTNNSFSYKISRANILAVLSLQLRNLFNKKLTFTVLGSRSITTFARTFVKLRPQQILGKDGWILILIKALSKANTKATYSARKEAWFRQPIAPNFKVHRNAN